MSHLLRKTTTILGIFVPFFACADISVGYGIGYDNLHVNAAIGNSTSATSTTPFHLFYMSRYARDARWYAEYSKSDFHFKGDVTNVGQNVSYTSLNAGWQTQFAVSRDFKPWLGLGLGGQSAKLSNRHTTLANGFLNQTFPDEEVSTLQWFVDASHDFALSEQTFLNTRIQYVSPTSNGVGYYGITGVFMYQFK